VPPPGVPSVRFVIHTLPVLARMAACDAALGHNWRLAQGLSAETSGGLLVALPPEQAAAYAAAVAAADGRPAWVIGTVEAGPPGLAEVDAAVIAPDAAVVEVDFDLAATGTGPVPLPASYAVPAPQAHA
jgi:selenide, water dikinase